MQAEVSAADAGLGKKDSLVVLRKRLQENDVNESSNIKINTLLGVAATLLLTILLVIYIVAGGKHEPPSTPRDYSSITGEHPSHRASLLRSFSWATEFDLVCTRAFLSGLQEDQVNQMSGTLAPDTNVYIRNFGKGEKWKTGTVKSADGAMTVTVETPEGLVRRHVDQVHTRFDSVEPHRNREGESMPTSRTTQETSGSGPNVKAELLEPPHQLQSSSPTQDQEKQKSREPTKERIYVESTNDDLKAFATEVTEFPITTSKRTRRSKMGLSSERASKHTRPMDHSTYTDQQYATT
ncbi:hypothetical protein MRX96_017847 [Rhipicephalus microplus]